MLKRLAAAAAAVTIAVSTPAYAGQWVQDGVGWRWQLDDGSYLKGHCWVWIDGNHDGIAESYSFDYKTGYITYDVADQGVTVNENGALLHNGVVATDVIPGGSDYLPGMAGDDGKIFHLVFTPDESVHELNAKIQAEKEQKEAEKEQKEAEKERKKAEEAAWIESIDVDKVAYRIAEMVNEERVSKGYYELVINDELMENAAVRAEEGDELYAHRRPDGSNIETVVTVENRGVAENLASVPILMGETEEELAQLFMDAWLNSAGHRHNIFTSRGDEIGVGVYKSGNSLVGCQLFIQN